MQLVRDNVGTAPVPHGVHWAERGFATWQRTVPWTYLGILKRPTALEPIRAR